MTPPLPVCGELDLPLVAEVEGVLLLLPPPLDVPPPEELVPPPTVVTPPVTPVPELVPPDECTVPATPPVVVSSAADGTVTGPPSCANSYATAPPRPSVAKTLSVMNTIATRSLMGRLPLGFEESKEAIRDALPRQTISAPLRRGEFA
jgi:hypothetical protein